MSFSDKLGKAVNYIGVAALCLSVGIASATYYHEKHSVRYIEIPEEPISDSTIANTLKVSEQKYAPQVKKKVTAAQQGKTVPVYTYDSTVPQEKVDATVKNMGGNYNLKETKADGNTNIYSVKIKKASHGAGLYAGARRQEGEIQGEYGVHYRANRWIYQVGVDSKGKLGGRVGYELIQW